MYGDRRRTAVLHAFRKLHGIAVVSPEALAELHRDRLADPAADRLYDLTGKLRILHKRRTLSIIYNLWHRTAHVDVQNIKRPLLNLSRHVRHQCRLRTKQLQCQRSFLLLCHPEKLCIFILIEDSLGTDHFCIDKIRPLLLT